MVFADYIVLFDTLRPFSNGPIRRSYFKVISNLRVELWSTTWSCAGQVNDVLVIEGNLMTCLGSAIPCSILRTSVLQQHCCGQAVYRPAGQSIFIVSTDCLLTTQCLSRQFIELLVISRPFNGLLRSGIGVQSLHRFVVRRIGIAHQ